MSRFPFNDWTIGETDRLKIMVQKRLPLDAICRVLGAPPIEFAVCGAKARSPEEVQNKIVRLTEEGSLLYACAALYF